ncbi:MAG TPA: cyclic nucleotide-binding domain-containing protein [Candidatus Limnocylindrales bacterium]|nr:cyclic nucleotide-binding domain-containing protein [Candidatus Limnocylindrales bacterium]
MGAIRDVLRVPDCRRIEGGSFASLAGELAGTIALLVYAYSEGGAALVAIYGVVRTLPAMAITPAVVSSTDRFGPDRVLRITVAARALVLAAAAIGAFVGAPSFLVIGAGAMGSWLAGAYRPIQASVLPWLARTPGELTAANVVAALGENAATLLGPVLAGAALALFGVPAAIALSASLIALGSAMLWHLAVPSRGGASAGDSEPAPMGAMAAGAVDLARLAPPAGVTVLVFAQTFVRGALTVLIVVLALDVLLLGDAAVGWLTAAMGIGGLIGGAIAGAVLSVRNLARGFVAGLLLWGIPLTVLAAAPSTLTAYLALTVVGVGNALEDVSLFTLMPRAFRPRFVGRALGALELTVFAGIGLGSIAAPVLADTLGVRGALGALGGGLTALAALYAVRFVRLDADLPVPGPETVLLHRNPIFAPLSLATVELLASQLTAELFDAGEVVMAEGEAGDRFHLIADGNAAVSVEGVVRATLGVGDGFGEIALLRDIPRTATVTAVGPLRTFSLVRDEFLVAVGSSPLATASAAAAAEDRLAADRAIRTTQPDA